MCMFCRSLFVLLSFFFWPFVVCSSLIYGFWLPLLVSSNSSCTSYLNLLHQCRSLHYIPRGWGSFLYTGISSFQIYQYLVHCILQYINGWVILSLDIPTGHISITPCSFCISKINSVKCFITRKSFWVLSNPIKCKIDTLDFNQIYDGPITTLYKKGYGFRTSNILMSSSSVFMLGE